MRKNLGTLLVVVSLIMITVGGYLYMDGNPNKLDNEPIGNEENTTIPPKGDEGGDENTVDPFDTVDMKKDIYLMSASGMIEAISLEIMGMTEGFSMNKIEYAYYVPVSNDLEFGCNYLELGGKSPFGEWNNAFVVVTVNSDGTYEYSFVGLDSAGYGFGPAQEGSSSWTKENI